MSPADTLEVPDDLEQLSPGELFRIAARVGVATATGITHAALVQAIRRTAL